MSSQQPLRVAFLGCGFITRVHSRHLRALGGTIVASYASRDLAKAQAFARQFGGERAYGSYQAAIDDPRIEAVVIAVPPRFHLDVALQALAAGRHVLVEKPAFPAQADFARVIEARDRARRVVLVGENDHYKPLAVCLRTLLADDAVGDLVFVQINTIARRLKEEGDWRNDEEMAGGDAFFEEGIHWLHLAGSLGHQIRTAHGLRPGGILDGPDRRLKSMLVALDYESCAVGAIFYSREIPSLLRGLRLSKLFGRAGIITFESNGLFVLVRGRGWPRLILPGFRDMRGYRAMYRDFLASIRSGRAPEMSLERALEDQRLMEQIYREAGGTRAS